MRKYQTRMSPSSTDRGRKGRGPCGRARDWAISTLLRRASMRVCDAHGCDAAAPAVAVPASAAAAAAPAAAAPAQRLGSGSSLLGARRAPLLRSLRRALCQWFRCAACANIKVDIFATLYVVLFVFQIQRADTPGPPTHPTRAPRRKIAISGPYCLLSSSKRSDLRVKPSTTVSYTQRVVIRFLSNSSRAALIVFSSAAH